MDIREALSDLRQYLINCQQQLLYVADPEARGALAANLRHAMDLVDEAEQAAPVAATVGEAR